MIKCKDILQHKAERERIKKEKREAQLRASQEQFKKLMPLIIIGLIIMIILIIISLVVWY